MKVSYPFYNLFLYLLIDREDFTLPFLKVDLTKKYCNIMKINIFISLVPVSYTHLDVYKRQTYDSPILDEK